MTEPVQQKQRKSHPYIVSKRNPTQLNPRVKPIVSEADDLAFVACGHTIQVYSLITGILIDHFRSKRNNIEGKKGLKGDVHRGTIVALGYQDNKLISLCSKAILAEWNPKGGMLLNFEQVKGLTNVKLAAITNEHIVTYERLQGVIQVRDLQTKNLQHEHKEQQNLKHKIKAMTAQGKTIAYIQGRQVIVLNFAGKQIEVKHIKRDSILTTLAINNSGSLLAVGDDYGKIYIVHNFNNDKQVVIQTMHWHSHAVNTLEFMPDSPYLLSGGKEAVLVQWHLEQQSKTFISRVGNEIVNIGLSSPNQTTYSLIMKDNSFKVVRFDNNKTLINAHHLKYKKDQQVSITNDGKLVVANKCDLTFYDLTQTHRNIQSLSVKPRNYVSAPFKEKQVPEAVVTSFALTPDQKTLVTFEELADTGSNKDVRIQTLKFWYRDQVSEDPSDFTLSQQLQDPCLSPKYGMLVASIDNTTIVTANHCYVKVWKQFEQGKWILYHDFDYQGMKVAQIIGDVKLRLGCVKNPRDGTSPHCLALLHKDGLITFWNLQTWVLTYAIHLNAPSHKVIFEMSYRFLASLNENGGVEVWQMNGIQEKHHWNLSFSSVTDIVANSSKENQFFVQLNSQDDISQSPDSILLFQFSRPQNLVMYWKMQLPFMKMAFAELDPSFLLVINSNQELQRIYCDVTRSDLKNVAEKRRMSLDFKQKEQVNLIDETKTADYQFIEKKTERRMSDVRERDLLVGQQEAQIMRLDKVDKALDDSEFLQMPSLGFYLKSLVTEMLIKPSTAQNFLDLQSELNQETFAHSYQQDTNMDVEEDSSKKFQIQDLASEMEQLFAKMLK